MTTTKCTKCKREFSEEELIKTDEFREFGSEVKTYCADCFLEEVKNGFGHYDIGICEACKSPLVLQYDDEETVSLAKFDYTVRFTCPQIKAAIEQDDIPELERLEEEEHESLMLYTIEPDPESVEFGYDE